MPWSWLHILFSIMESLQLLLQRRDMIWTTCGSWLHQDALPSDRSALVTCLKHLSWIQAPVSRRLMVLSVSLSLFSSVSFLFLFPFPSPSLLPTFSLPTMFHDFSCRGTNNRLFSHISINNIPKKKKKRYNSSPVWWTNRVTGTWLRGYLHNHGWLKVTKRPTLVNVCMQHVTPSLYSLVCGH